MASLLDKNRTRPEGHHRRIVKGQRVRLVSKVYRGTLYRPGDEGEVVLTCLSSHGLLIDVRWDAGYRCSVSPAHGDVIEVIPPADIVPMAPPGSRRLRKRSVASDPQDAVNVAPGASQGL